MNKVCVQMQVLQYCAAIFSHELCAFCWSIVGAAPLHTKLSECEENGMGLTGACPPAVYLTEKV